MAGRVLPSEPVKRSSDIGVNSGPTLSLKMLKPAPVRVVSSARMDTISADEGALFLIQHAMDRRDAPSHLGR